MLTTYPDGRPKTGICGRDRHGNPTVPAGLEGNALHRTMTLQDSESPEAQNLLQKQQLNSWPVFENPSPDVLKEREIWPNQ